MGKDENGNSLNPLDAHFRSLYLSKMDAVAKTSNEYDQLRTYVKNTHGQSHHIKVEVLNAFRVERYVCHSVLTKRLEYIDADYMYYVIQGKMRPTRS